MSMPMTMVAIEIEAKSLKLATRPVPRPDTTEVLIKVEAAGVNRPDIAQRQGHYPPPSGVTNIPGLEVAGKIIDIGVDVRNWKRGDEVCALVSGGGYADYCVAPALQCLRIPAGLTFVEAAAIPETFFTVWSTVFDIAKFQPGEKVLVHGGGSGIGTTAIQLVKAFGGVVFVTCGTDYKCEKCKKLGVTVAVNYKKKDFVESLKGNEMNIILDMVGGDYVARNLQLLALDGRHVSIALLRGPEAKVDIPMLLKKRLSLFGATLRARPVEQKAKIAEALKAMVWPLLESKRIKPVIDTTFLIKDASLAHAYMESGTHFGKIVLTLE